MVNSLHEMHEKLVDTMKAMLLACNTTLKEYEMSKEYFLANAGKN